MARGNKNLAGFEDVARKDEPKKPNVNINANDNDIVKEEPVVQEFQKSSVVGDEIDQIVSSLDNNKNKPEKELVGLYLDPDVKKALQRMNKKKGRGWQSEFANSLIRAALERKGWLN
jgi:uncharacterized protein (DUF4415 family)